MSAAEKPTTVVSTKGQVILPKAIRQQRRWEAGTRLVVEDTPDGVLLRIVESGFNAIPETRRATAFGANSEGWSKQAELVRKYLSVEQWV